MKVDPNGEENTEYNQIHSYSLQLPTIKQLMSQKSLPQETSTKPTKDEKIETSGKFAMAVMGSPNGTKDYTIEKEIQHKESVKSRTTFGSYTSRNGDLPYIDPEGLLKATIKHRSIL